MTEAPKSAAKKLTGPAVDDMVKCKVTKHGDGKISTGVRAPSGTVDEDGAAVGDLMHEKGDVIETRRSIAEALEARHYVEIE